MYMYAAHTLLIARSPTQWPKLMDPSLRTAACGPKLCGGSGSADPKSVARASGYEPAGRTSWTRSWQPHRWPGRVDPISWAKIRSPLEQGNPCVT